MIRSDTCGGEARDLFLASLAGYLTDSMSVDALVGAIKLIVAGEIFVPVDIMNASIKEARGRLTKREREFLPGLLAGQSNHKIAKHLGLSEVTFKDHLNGLSSKLGENKEPSLFALRLTLG